MAFWASDENSVACVEIKECQFTHSSADRRLSINTLMEKVKLIVMEKYEFDYPGISKLLSIPGFFGLSVFGFKDQNP